MMKLALSAILLMTLVNAGEIVQCSDRRAYYFKFFPINFATLLPGESATVQGRCFSNIQFSVRETDTDFEVHYFAKDKTSWLCSEPFIFSTGKSYTARFPFIVGSDMATFSKASITPDEAEHIRERGVRVLLSCDDMSNWPKSAWMTIKLFFGGLGLNPYVPIFGSKIPEYQLAANLDWISGSAGYELQRYPSDRFVHIDKKLIKSGTILGVYRFDGVDTMINVGSGSRLGHITMALWHEDELYVIESQDAPYWPTQGIQMTTYDRWLKLAHNADYNVIILPLTDAHQAKFDEAKAWAWYEEVTGDDYGYHNFLFGFIDDTDRNLPYTVDLDFASIVIETAQLIIPKTVNLIFMEAFNLRLGKQVDTVKDVWDEIYARKMRMQDLMNIPEQEGWIYSDGVNYVCSAFAISVYKRAGLFGDLEINSTEFTPKDLYELNFFDVSGAKVPEGCEGYADYGYCQIMGKVRLDLGNVAFVEPYAHMDERCPTTAPEYNRTPGC